MSIAELRFLAVEDHEFQRGIWLRILAGLGATKVSVAADGREALSKVLDPQAPIDIIISDLDMPGMDGAEFMRHLGKAGLPVSVILASALDALLLDSVRIHAREYGVRILGIIEKPITPRKLAALIALHEAGQPHRPARRAPSAPMTLDRMVKGLKNLRDRWLRSLRPASAIDSSVLAAISGGDAAAERQMLQEFMRINDHDAALLLLAVERRDLAQVSEASERILGASRTAGATALAEVCERLQRACVFTDWKAIDKHMRSFRRDLERVRSSCDGVRSSCDGASGPCGEEK